MFDPREIGRITPDEQADALRTLLATFATSVVRAGGSPPRNAVSMEILDILDEVPPDRIEAVAQLLTAMVLRLRRRGPRRRLAFRLALEDALLIRRFAGLSGVESEVAYLTAGRPGLGDIDTACETLLRRLAREAPEDRRAWLAAQATAAAMIDADASQPLGGRNRDPGDMAVVEFLMRTAAQYLAGTGTGSGAAGGGADG